LAGDVGPNEAEVGRELVEVSHDVVVEANPNFLHSAMYCVVMG